MASGLIVSVQALDGVHGAGYLSLSYAQANVWRWIYA